jgi:hypothetical protein
MVTFFNDASTWREWNTWKAPVTDMSALLARTAEQFAKDVCWELKSYIGQVAL